MWVDKVYLCKLTGKKYRITALGWGNAHATNINDSSDVIFIALTDLANGHYTLFEPSQELLPTSSTIQECGDFHYWQNELNFQFETEYCRRCGVKKGN